MEYNELQTMGQERHPNQPYAGYLHRCILWTDTDRAHCMATSNTTHSIGGGWPIDCNYVVSWSRAELALRQLHAL